MQATSASALSSQVNSYAASCTQSRHLVSLLFFDATFHLRRDDGEDIRSQPVARQNGAPSKPAFPPEDIPFSNDGLILPGTFFGADNGLPDINGSNTFKYELAPHKFERGRSSGSGGVGSTRSDSTRDHRQLYYNGNGRSRKSTGQQVLKPGPMARGVDLQNLAKRRKTEGAPFSQPQAHPEYPPILPPPSRSGILRSGVRPVIASKTVKAPQINSTEGRRAKQKPLTAAERITIDEMRLYDVAENRVLKHIRNAIEKYGDRLSKEKRKYIANNVRI
jgi:hypothetical protein